MSYVETQEPRRAKRNGKDGRNVSEKAKGGGDDSGVVYLGRNSFKMKVGPQLTPPVGTPAAVVAATPTPRPSVTTPPSSPGTLRRAALSYRPLPAPLPEQGGWGKGRGLVVVGLCMIAFSCGVMTTVAVDGFWPRAKTQCVSYQAEAAGIGVGAIGPVAVPPPPAAPAPAVAEALPPPDPEPAVAPAAASTVPVPAVVSTPRAGRSAVARTPAGRGGARVRPAASAPKASLETMHPTGIFVDPFAD
jgi:hypothetical protein